MKTGAKIDVTVTPTISVKVPAMPKRFKNGAKRPSLNILDKIGERNQFNYAKHSQIRTRDIVVQADVVQADVVLICRVFSE